MQGFANAMHMRQKGGEGGDEGAKRRKRRGRALQPAEGAFGHNKGSCSWKRKTLPRAPHLVPHTQRPRHASHRRHTFVGKRVGTWTIPGSWQQRRKREARCSGSVVRQSQARVKAWACVYTRQQMQSSS